MSQGVVGAPGSIEKRNETQSSVVLLPYAALRSRPAGGWHVIRTTSPNRCYGNAPSPSSRGTQRSTRPSRGSNRSRRSRAGCTKRSHVRAAPFEATDLAHELFAGALALLPERGNLRL